MKSEQETRSYYAEGTDRLAFLDSLRGIGVLCVFIHHVFIHLYPAAYFPWVSKYLDIGQLGVAVFFFCSGFIIPTSLEKGGSLRVFWIRRFFRLYPLYWFSVAAAIVLYVTHVVSGDNPISHLPVHEILPREPAKTVVANVSMLPSLFGSPALIALYWTLEVEMLFYVVASVLFALGLFSRLVPIAVGVLGLAVVCAAFEILYFIPIPVYLGMMFSGALMYRAYSGEISRSAAQTLALLSLLMLVLAAYLYRNAGGLWSLQAMLTSWIGAFAIFGLMFLARARSQPKSMLWLGRISYSVYLIHLSVIALVPFIAHWAVSTVLWLAVSLLVSAATYTYIERPAIRLARRLSAR